MTWAPTSDKPSLTASSPLDPSWLFSQVGSSSDVRGSCRALGGGSGQVGITGLLVAYWRAHDAYTAARTTATVCAWWGLVNVAALIWMVHHDGFRHVSTLAESIGVPILGAFAITSAIGIAVAWSILGAALGILRDGILMGRAHRVRTDCLARLDGSTPSSTRGRGDHHRRLLAGW